MSDRTRDTVDTSERKSTTDDTSEREPTAGTHRQIAIPEEVAVAIEDRIAATKFDSIDGYVTFVLESVLRELDATADVDDRGNPGRAAAPGDGEKANDERENETPNDEQNGDGPRDRRNGDGTDTAEIEDRLESLGYL